ncbi:MAG: alpha/beta hydrolase [Dehalococcoidales bacterium]
MKWWLKLGLALTLIVAVTVLGISSFLGYSMTKVERISIEENPASLGLEYEDVSFPSRGDELTLRGWYLPVEDSEKVIIMLHGGEGHRADPAAKMLDIAAGLVEHGYNVLMFDLRGHGESDGNRMSAGYYEKRDALGAIDYVKGRGFKRIGVLGFSMGAATALMATAENGDVDAIVADSSFADLKDMMEPEFSKRTNFPKFFLPTLLFMVKIMYGVDFNAIKPVELVSKLAPRPVFFIHGELDEIVPLEHAYRLQQASQNPQNQLWIVPQAGHVESYVTHPEEYLSKVTTFFDEALK